MTVASLTKALFGFAMSGTLAGAAAVAVEGGAPVWVSLTAWVVRALQPPWDGVGLFSLGMLALSGVFWGAEQASRQLSGRAGAGDKHLGDAPSRRVILERARRCLEGLLLGRRVQIVEALDEIVRAAVDVSASDVHLGPARGRFQVCLRVDGTVSELCLLSREVGARLVSRIKVVAGLQIHVTRKPQDGRLVLPLGDDAVEARVSTLPVEGGERVVLRLVRGAGPVPSLEALGLSTGCSDALARLLAKPEGIVFVTGPVGSGKTTTLYSALHHVVSQRGATATAVTLEDPIELQLPFATQTQVDELVGRSFAKTLRSVLRQDPTLIMVGEIRDRETADIAMQAGLSGHLILTTLHADGAAGPFARLMDMGVEPFAVASATLGSLAQRLVRTLCPACKCPHKVSEQELEALQALGYEPPDNPMGPVGCSECEGTGFAGRSPIGELLAMSPELRQAVNQQRPSLELRELARGKGFVSLLEDGLDRVAKGHTSLREVLRVAG